MPDYPRVWFRVPRVLWLVAGVALAILSFRVSSAQQTIDAAFVPGELLVKFRPAASEGQRDVARRTVGTRLLRRFEHLDMEHVQLPSNLTVANALRILRASPNVLLAEPNYVQYIAAAASPNDPRWLDNTLWGMLKINMGAAWTNFGTGSSSVVVAVIDTGVNYNHPDLAANIWSAATPYTVQGVTCAAGRHGLNVTTSPPTCDPLDDNGHGTHTSGTIGAVGNNGIGVVGVNWNVKLLSCKFLRANGSGSTSGAAACFDFLVGLKQQGINIRVASNSWGAARQGTDPDPAMQTAIDNAGNAGILSVFAAGNSSTNNDVTPFDPASFNSSSLVSVAASDSDDMPAGFSNYGATTVDLAAPGVSIYSTIFGDYDYLSGTSMATPHVAGVAALLASVKPSLTVSGLKTALMQGVDHLGQWSGKVVWGGRLNAFASLLSTDSLPTVTLGTNGTVFNAPATIVLTATANDTDGTIRQVDFSTASAPIGTVLGPFAMTWSGVPAGTYQLKAVATDNVGGMGTSNLVTVTVVGDATPPTVSLTQPTANSVLSGGGLTLSADAHDDIAIAGVQFQVDGNNLGAEVSSAPYSAVWDSTTVSNGTHTLSAIARDSSSNKTTASVVVSVANSGLADTSHAAVSTFAGNAQHTAIYQPTAQDLNAVRWSVPIDLNPGAFAHYGAPMISAANTVFVPVKTAANAFQVQVVSGVDGTSKYATLGTDYIMPSHSWIPTYSPALATHVDSVTGRPVTRLYYAAAGGTVFYIDNPDSSGHGVPVRQTFFGLAAYQANQSGFNASVFINTPLTPDSQGNIYFGFRVQGTAPAPLNTGQSGFARIDPNGNGVMTLAGSAAGDAAIASDSHDSAPALSNDESTVYVAVKSPTTSAYAYLLGLNATTLATKYKVFLRDPRNGHANPASVLDISTASPTVGPDGDVYFGILSNPDNGSRGFLLHFSGDLATEKTPGGFGWDYTPAIVPASAVPSYAGTSSYLIFAKYNNYAGHGDGDGVNRIALLDPNATQIDPHSNAGGLLEMREVLTIIGPTPDDESISPTFPNARREWCINTAAVNPATSSVFMTSEDGHLYRWDLSANALTQAVVLTEGIGEPYVPTVIGPDGTVFTLNGGTLFAVGAAGGLDITLTSSRADAAGAVAGQSLTFTATVTNGVTPASGAVTFDDVYYPEQTLTATTSRLAQSVPLSGGHASFTTSTLGGGNHFITATFDGSSTSVTLVQKVHPFSTTTTVAASPSPAVVGQSVSVTATVTSASGIPTGQVTFRDNGSVLAQVPLVAGSSSSAAGVATSALAAGTHTITAVYASDSLFGGSTGSASATVTTPGGLLPSQTLLTTQVPASTNAGAYELGLRVVPDIAGQITGVRFWKAAGETGTHTGRVWSAGGQLLASVVFANETPSGWQEQTLPAALTTLVNTPYVISVNANSTWMATANFFTTPLVNGHLTGPAGSNGVYGTPGGFPTSTYASFNYFQDVVFVPDLGLPTRIMSLGGNLGFGNVAVNTTATRTLTIGNTGTMPLTVSSVSYPGGFSGDWASGTIAAGASQNVTVTFAPTALTSYGGTITVTADQTSGTNTIASSGTGTAVTRIVALSGNLAFGNVTVNTTATSVLSVGNSGSAALTVSGISYPAGFSGNWAGGTIPAGGSQNVTVTFAPAAATAYGGTITVTGDQTSGTNTIAASGTGSASLPSQTLLTTQVPTSTNAGAYELGLRVVPDVAGQITAVRFWKAAGDIGTHTGRVWSAGGQLLASVVFANETASGWQEQPLPAALATLANTPYVISVNANSTWLATASFFTTPLVNGHLTGPAVNNGVYGPSGTFPTATYLNFNYFRDIVFFPQAGQSSQLRLERADPLPTNVEPASPAIAGSQPELIAGFFAFPDGPAGVPLQRTGEFYRDIELS